MSKRRSETIGGLGKVFDQFVGEGQEIIKQLNLPPVTEEAELQSMCRAIRKRGHLHDVEQLQQEKQRVLKSRRPQ
jgi:hypothetical protein